MDKKIAGEELLCFFGFFAFSVAWYGSFADDHDVSDGFHQLVRDDDAFCASEDFAQKGVFRCANAPCGDFGGC